MPILANQRRETFAQHIAQGTNGAAAYRQTYGTNGASAEANASRLLRNAKVRERVTELQSKVEKETLLTMHRRRQLLQQRAESPSITDSALVAILHLDAKLAGEFIDKSDLTTSGEALPSIVPSLNITIADHWKKPRT